MLSLHRRCRHVQWINSSILLLSPGNQRWYLYNKTWLLIPRSLWTRMYTLISNVKRSRKISLRPRTCVLLFRENQKRAYSIFSVWSCVQIFRVLGVRRSSSAHGTFFSGCSNWVGAVENIDYFINRKFSSTFCIRQLDNWNVTRTSLVVSQDKDNPLLLVVVPGAWSVLLGKVLKFFSASYCSSFLCRWSLC